jgi:hypothetical protein
LIELQVALDVIEQPLRQTEVPVRDAGDRRQRLGISEGACVSASPSSPHMCARMKRNSSVDRAAQLDEPYPRVQLRIARQAHIRPSRPA